MLTITLHEQLSFLFEFEEICQCGKGERGRSWLWIGWSFNPINVLQKRKLIYFFCQRNWKWIEPRRDESIHLFALLKKTTGDAALNFCPEIACFHSSDEQHFGRWHPLRPWMAFRFDHGRSFLGQYWENISIHVHFLQPEQSESKFNIISKRKETYSCALPVPQKTFSVIKNMIFFVLKPMNTSTLSRRKLMKL